MAKVIRIIARLNVGGPARHVAWLTAGLRAAGWNSVLIAGTVPPGEDDMSYFAAGLGVVPEIVPELSREVSPLQDLRAAWKLYRIFQRERPDVVHTHTAKAGTVGRAAGLLYRWLTPGALWCRPRRCRFVHTYHGHVFHSYFGKGKTRWFLGIERVLARIATDRIVVISPQQYQEIHEEFGVGRASQFRVIPLGLDVAEFDHGEVHRAAARAELNAGADELLVGIVGRLTEIKHHSLFLRAAALYLKTATTNNDQTRVRFVIVGDGHLRGALEAEANALGLGDAVTFTGSLDDAPRFYAALDVVALTSRNEGTPLTLIEAMASARPVIATAVGGVVDLLGASVVSSLSDRRDENGAKAGYTLCARGLAVAPGDAEAFAQGLKRLITNAALRRELGARGQAFVSTHYAKERLLTDVENLYRELLAPEATMVAPVRTTTDARPGVRSSTQL